MRMAEAHSDATRSHDAAQPLLDVRALGYAIGATHLINGIDLTLHDGGITVLMGPNGAGKSVLLRLLHGLLPPTTGTVLWRGKPASVDTRRRQSMVFQRPVLLRRSVKANIEFVMKLSGKRHSNASKRSAETWLADVGLADKAHQSALQLSGGEQQRLAMARALASKPDVVLMDEPTASLDPASVLTIERITQTASKNGVKIIWVTHDLGQAHRIADDVIFINHGCITEHSPAAQFFAKPASGEAQDYVAGRLVL